MNTEQYVARLKSLLVENYQTIKNGGLRKNSDPRIEGFMEAGLVLGVVSNESLRRIIDTAHLEVFGVPFAEKIRPKDANNELLDIPTWIRDNKKI